MKKSFVLTLLSLLVSTMMYAQVPQEFSYQSVIRNSAGKLMVFKQLNVSVSITTGGSSVFNENHSVVTSSNGLISLRIGSKNPSSFSSIDWGSGSHNIEVTVSDGQGLTISTENKLLSVPYALYSGGADSSGNLSTKLDEEIARAMAAEDTNATAIADEATRAKGAETANATAIADEITRAKAAETANATAIADEITRAKAAEANNATAIAEETTRAKAAEAANANTIVVERARMDGLEGELDQEIARAKAAEAANNHATGINANAIAAEETRAKTAEASNALAIAEETTRAKAAEATNATAIAEETTRAKAAEAANANTIVIERARMDGIEMELDSEIDRAKAAEAANANAIAALQTSEVTKLDELTDVVVKGGTSIYAGSPTLTSNTDAIKNTSFGIDALDAVTAGFNNTAFGYNALSNVKFGDYNTAVGQGAGLNVIGGNSNTFIGHNANTGPDQAGPSNRTAIGAGATATANKSVVLGNSSVDQIWMASDKDATVYAGGLNLGGTAIEASADEINYLDGVTSSLQAQINSLQAKIATLESSSRTDEEVQDLVGAMVSGNTESKIVVTYDDNNGKLDFSVDVTSPSITGSQNVSINEGETAVQSYSASESVTWSISGTDSSKFSLTQSTGAIAFSSAPNYETPTDADANNVYALTLTATDAVGNASSVNLSITVSNVVEAFNASDFSIQATTTTDTTAKINWTYTGEVGAPGVEGYFLWVRKGSGGSWGPVTVFRQDLGNSASITSYTIGGLQPGTMYSFRLWPLYNQGTQCKNCNGTGEPNFTTQAPQAN